MGAKPLSCAGCLQIESLVHTPTQGNALFGGSQFGNGQTKPLLCGLMGHMVPLKSHRLGHLDSHPAGDGMQLSPHSGTEQRGTSRRARPRGDHKVCHAQRMLSQG